MRKTYGFLLIATFILLMSETLGVAQPYGYKRASFRKAVNLYADADYAAAYALFSTLASRFPHEPEYSLYAGLSALNTSDVAQEALAWFEQGLQCDSMVLVNSGVWDDLMLAKAEALMALMRLDEAVGVCQQLIALASDPLVIAHARKKKQQAIRNRFFVENAIAATINNMGGIVNSRHDDHTGCLNLAGDILYFTSKRVVSSKSPDGQERVFFSRLKDSVWSSPLLLPLFGKKQAHESMLSLTCDESVMAVFLSDGGRQDIYTIQRVRDVWGKLRRFPEPVSSIWNQTHLSFSPDQSTVFFTSDRPGGFGGRDIYMSKLGNDHRWGPPRNLGPNVNTPLDEETPFMHANGHTLYFASEGHEGMGRFDVFFSEMQPDSSFSVASNMGYPINSMEDDFAFFPDISNRRAVLSSTRNDRKIGGCDLFMVGLDASSISHVAVLKLVANDSLGTVSRVLVQRQVDSLLVGDYRPNETSGEYTAFLETGYGYSFLNKTSGGSYNAMELYLTDSLAFNQNQRILGMSDLPMLVDPKSVVVEDETKGKDAATIEMEYYTIQVLALKRRPLFVNSHLRHLSRHPIRSLRCSDGYVRYLYGNFPSKTAALDELAAVKKMGRYRDAFVRSVRSVDVLAMP